MRALRDAPFTFRPVHNFRRLLVWQKAHAVVVEIERLVMRIPRRDNAELISQLRRAEVSIPANIVYGSGRASDREFVRYLGIALASAAEVEYHLELAADTGRILRDEFELRKTELVEIRKMLVGLIRRMNSNGETPDPSTGRV
jgi:four helix bundle protein